MPHSVPVSKLMTPSSLWPLLRADADVTVAIKILRIFSEDEKLEHGHSTPLVLDDDYNLLGFVHLTDLLKSIRHLWDKTEAQGDLDKATIPLKDLVIPFAGWVGPNDSILKALDIMLDHGVSVVPVMSDHKLQGVVKLGDIFNTVAALLFDKEIPAERERLISRFRL